MPELSKQKAWIGAFCPALARKKPTATVARAKKATTGPAPGNGGSGEADPSAPRRENHLGFFWRKPRADPPRAS